MNHRSIIACGLCRGASLTAMLFLILALTSCSRLLSERLVFASAEPRLGSVPPELRVWIVEDSDLESPRAKFLRAHVEVRVPPANGAAEPERLRLIRVRSQWSWWHDGLLAKLWLEAPIRLFTSFFECRKAGWDPNSLSSFVAFDLIARLLGEQGRNQVFPWKAFIVRGRSYFGSLVDWTAWLNPAMSLGATEYQVQVSETVLDVRRAALEGKMIGVVPASAWLDSNAWRGDCNIMVDDASLGRWIPGELYADGPIKVRMTVQLDQWGTYEGTWTSAWDRNRVKSRRVRLKRVEVDVDSAR